MIDVMKPVSHADDDAFCLMLEQYAKRVMQEEGREELEFILTKAAEKIREYKERYESVQADFERALAAMDKMERET